MDDFNPYRTPSSFSVAAATPRPPDLGWLYRLPNLLYAVLIVLATLILLVGNPQSLEDASAPLTLLVFYSPVLCYLLVRRGTARLLRFGLGLQALMVLWLSYRFIDNLLSGAPELRIGAVLLAVNLLALLGGLRQAKAQSLVKEQP
jgi:hypothetical protein